MSYLSVKREGYTVHFEEPTRYVDNQSRGRSGHMSHALARFSPTSFIDFNSNCSAKRWEGHSPYGWIEYRTSGDAGKTYSPVKKLPYSVESFEDGIYMISVEKAVVCDDGTLVAFCLRNEGTNLGCCTPWHTPTVIRSTDGGETWSEPVEYSPLAGRTYDARIYRGDIYVMHHPYPEFLGTAPEHSYRLYKSTDNGKSFKEVSVIGLPYERRGYGAIIFDADGKLHAYAYNEQAETEMDHAVSEDLGETWTLFPPCHLNEGIRNPQIGYLDGVYILHGRAAQEKGFVFYTSTDATSWDAGTFLHDTKGLCFYSNNLNLTDEQGDFLLVQYSISYDGPRVNVNHVVLRVEK
ncbi:MAG: exo-alpha-sialidase [Clostridia bacterium]|nr:exo-alpha-sialidase [Clostridia bacterium]